MALWWHCSIWNDGNAQQSQRHAARNSSSERRNVLELSHRDVQKENEREKGRGRAKHVNTLRHYDLDELNATSDCAVKSQRPRTVSFCVYHTHLFPSNESHYYGDTLFVMLLRRAVSVIAAHDFMKWVEAFLLDFLSAAPFLFSPPFPLEIEAHQLHKWREEKRNKSTELTEPSYVIKYVYRD